MMHLNTLEFYKDLVHAGIKEQAAEVIVKGIEESKKIDLTHLATKQDLKDMTNEIKNEIKEISFKVNLIYKASAVILVSVIIPLVLKVFDYVVPRLMH
jgi:hypothetical protein